MRCLKFGLVFDLNFFHHSDLYQVNKTLLKFDIYSFISRIYYLCQLLRNNNLVHRLKNYLGEPTIADKIFDQSRKIQ